MSQDLSTTSYFSQHAERFTEQYARKACFKDRYSLFIDALRTNVSPPAKVLDFGCGPGVMALSLGQVGYEILGIDGSPGMIEAARSARETDSIANATFEVQAAEEANLPPDHFDGIICSSVIEYLPADLGVVAQLTRSLKRGGYLVISVPNRWSLPGLAEQVLRSTRRHRTGATGSHLSYSLRHYARRQFLAELVRSGLTPTRWTTFEFPLFGDFGVRLSRIPMLGGMILVVARRES